MQLRKLTLKSKIGFGINRDKTVSRMLERLIYIWYLQWMYFNCSHIDFVDEVFIAAGLLDEHKIEKPGVNRQLFLDVYKPIQVAERREYHIEFDVATGRNRKIMTYKPEQKQTKERLRNRNNSFKPFYK